MKAFWWYDEGQLAGMARLGFNRLGWFDLKYDEAVVLGWVGRFGSGDCALSDFHRHLAEYAPKVGKYYGLIPSKINEVLDRLRDEEVFGSVLERVQKKTGTLDGFQVTGGVVDLSFCEARKQEEIDFFKKNGVGTVISLTEKQHDSTLLQENFECHHFSVSDLYPPTLEQVKEVSTILKEAEERQSIVAVHCLAGIGRTSTMILSAMAHAGVPLEELKIKISQRNPSFQLTGEQADFVESFSQ